MQNEYELHQSRFAMFGDARERPERERNFDYCKDGEGDVKQDDGDEAPEGGLNLVDAVLNGFKLEPESPKPTRAEHRPNDCGVCQLHLDKKCEMCNHPESSKR